MRSSLVSILSFLATDATIPGMVGVILNKDHIGDIRRNKLAIVLSHVEFAVGDCITLEEVWADDPYPFYWEREDGIVLYLTSEGWIMDRPFKVEDNIPQGEDGLRRMLRNPWTVTKELAHRFWGLTPGAKRIHKKQAARFDRRNSRRIIEEEMV